MENHEGSNFGLSLINCCNSFKPTIIKAMASSLTRSLFLKTLTEVCDIIFAIFPTNPFSQKT